LTLPSRGRRPANRAPPLMSNVKRMPMLSWFKRKEVAAVLPSSRDALLNEGLDLAMEWGKNWLKPIQDRLAFGHPELTREELDEVNAISQNAMKFGHGYVYDLALKAGKDTKKSDLESAMQSRYPWVNARNLSHLFSQGMYYAWKDTGLA
ncbi:MAG TPA: hypothetical protein VGV14_09685, partial [Rhodanobacter sp.]|nr:hypothetical protein [Rhodanobacter sp.]